MSLIAVMVDVVVPLDVTVEAVVVVAMNAVVDGTVEAVVL